MRVSYQKQADHALIFERARAPNGNFQDIGVALSNSLGNYAIEWTPPVPGLYTVTATFDGSDSYYRSEAGTSFVVSKAPGAAVVTPAPTATQPASTVSPTPPQTPVQSVSPSPTQAVTPPASAEPVSKYIAVTVAIIAIVAVAAAFILRRRK